MWCGWQRTQLVVMWETNECEATPVLEWRVASSRDAGTPPQPTGSVVGVVTFSDPDRTVLMYVCSCVATPIVRVSPSFRLPASRHGATCGHGCVGYAVGEDIRAAYLCAGIMPGWFAGRCCHAQSNLSLSIAR